MTLRRQRCWHSSRQSWGANLLPALPNTTVQAVVLVKADDMTLIECVLAWLETHDKAQAKLAAGYGMTVDELVACVRSINAR